MPLKHEENVQRGHPAVWAFLTIVSFPIVLMASDALGARGLWPFVLAIVATLAVLILELFVRGSMWPFEDGFAEYIGHPDTPIRILLFVGAILLVLETALIFTVTTDRRMDPELVRFVMSKQCAGHPDKLLGSLCGLFQSNEKSPGSAVTQGDLVAYMLRTHAAATWFPGETLATCGERLMAREIDADGVTMRESVLMSCTAWSIGEQGELRAKTTKTSIIGASLQRQSDGSLTLISWSEDVNTPSWQTTLGSIADSTRQQAESLEILPSLEEGLQQDALQQALALLKK